MTSTERTIKIANQHVANGNTDGALRILDSALRGALSSRTAAPLYLAKMKIVDAMIDATVARSQVSA